jgi:predicted ATPase
MAHKRKAEMRYTRFSFKNFKGIEQMTLPLEGGVTTLIGLNESGKTTILEAIFSFTYGAEDLDAINPGMASLRDPEQWIPISQRANFNDDISIISHVALEPDDKRELLKHIRSKCGVRLTKVSDEIVITERYTFVNSRHTNTQRLWNLALEGLAGQQRVARAFPGRSEVWNECVAYLLPRLPRIWYFPDFLFELPEKFMLTIPPGSPESSKEVLDKDRFYRTTFENVLDQLGIGATLETHVVERLKSTQRTDQRSLNAVLLDMSRSITNTVFQGWNRIFGRDPVAQEVEIGAEIEPDGNAFLDLKIKGADGYYDLSERSLGFRWFFMFLLMTSFAGNGASSSKPLFLLDEPASNLHSSAQAELLKSFEKLIDRCNLVYTTHSHHLINIRWLDTAYVVKNAALGSLELSDYLNSRIGARTSITVTKYRQFVAQHPDQTSYFQPVLDLLDYRPSVVEPVPDVILVEGKSDFYILRYMTEVIGVDSKLRFVPGTGAGSLDTLIRLHIGWGKSFLVLLDGDAEGNKQLKRYETEFGPMIKGHCVLLPDVCGDPKIKEAEDLLSQKDKEQIITAIFPDEVRSNIRKKVLYNAVMELYASKKTAPIEADTVERFVRLLAELAQRLV